MKIIFYFLCLFFLVTLNANSEKISKIEIQGNKRITNETIKLFSGVNKFKNKSLSENDLNYILKQLYETDFFQNVNINLKNNILTINVIENPLIQSVKFEGIKNKKILQFLNEQIQLKERTSYLKNKIKKVKMRKIVLIVPLSILKSLKLIGKNEMGFQFRFLVFYLTQSSSNHL